MAIVLPIKELTEDPYRISELCHSHNEPIFITKDGYGDMVVMNFDYYQKLKSQAEANVARAKLDFSKPVKIDDNIDEIKEIEDEKPEEANEDAAQEKKNGDIRTVLQKAVEKNGIEKIPLEDVIDIFKSELERQKDMDNRKRFP